MRQDQIKTANEGKRVGLSNKLKEGKSAFGSRNFSLALPYEKRAASNMRNKLVPLGVTASDVQGRRISLDPHSIMKTYQTIGSKTIDLDIDLNGLKDIDLYDNNIGVKSKLNKVRQID